MAENNEYHIYLRLDELADGSASAVANTGAKSTGDNGESASGGSMGAVANKVKSLVSFAAVKSTADQIANYKIGQVSLRTGATEYEQRLSTVYNAVSQTVGAGAALIMGGITAGPAGLAVAAIGVAVSGVQKVVSIAKKAENLRLQESLEDISIGMARTRAGVSGRR